MRLTLSEEFSFSFLKEMRPEAAAPDEVPVFANTEPEVTDLTSDADHLTAATFNIAGVASFSTGALADNADEVANQIVTNMRSPDIIALQEVSNARTTEQLDAIIDAIVAAGGPEYSYVFVENTQAGSGGVSAITNAFLYLPDRVEYVAGSAELITSVDHGSSFPRFPLAADFVFNGEQITVVNVHLKSGSKGSDPDTNRNAADRLTEAGQLSTLLDSYLDDNGGTHIILLGDINDEKTSEPIIELADDELWNIVSEVAVGDDTTDRYGAAIDHILVSRSLAATAQLDYVHVNADFGQPASDHDPVVARILIRQNTVEDFANFSFAASAEEATSVDVSLTNAGHLTDYFSASDITVEQILVLQDGIDDFQIQIETTDGWAAFSFADVGSMGEDATANLIEFLGAMEASGLPLYGSTIVGQHSSLAGGSGDSYQYHNLTHALVWNGSSPSDKLLGTGSSTLAGDDDFLFGNNNRDSYGEVLRGGSGEDFLFAARGQDTLDGGADGDRYFYRLGDGDDEISDSGEEDDGTDILIFGEGITAEDLSLAQNPDDANEWLLTIDDGSSDPAVITLRDGADSYGGIDEIHLADGTILSDATGFGLV